jgi:hypothetical protein
MIMIEELYTNNMKKGLLITLGICDNVLSQFLQNEDIESM